MGASYNFTGFERSRRNIEKRKDRESGWRDDSDRQKEVYPENAWLYIDQPCEDDESQRQSPGEQKRALRRLNRYLGDFLGVIIGPQF